METIFIIALIILWVIVLGLLVGFFAIARQLGVVFERIAPAGALSLPGGPKVGEKSKLFKLKSLNLGEISIGGEKDKKSILIFFMSPSCPICDSLLSVVRSIAKAESNWLDVVLASDGEADEHLEYIAKKNIRDLPYVVSTELGVTFEVSKLPYGVLLDGENILKAKGLTNTREHIESLFQAMDLGVASFNEYMNKEIKDPVVKVVESRGSA